MKYLIDLFAPYGSSLETNISLASMSSTLNVFVFVKFTFLIFLSPKFIYIYIYGIHH